MITTTSSVMSGSFMSEALTGFGRAFAFPSTVELLPGLRAQLRGLPRLRAATGPAHGRSAGYLRPTTLQPFGRTHDRSGWKR